MTKNIVQTCFKVDSTSTYNSKSCRKAFRLFQENFLMMKKSGFRNYNINYYRKKLSKFVTKINTKEAVENFHHYNKNIIGIYDTIDILENFKNNISDKDILLGQISDFSNQLYIFTKKEYFDIISKSKTIDLDYVSKNPKLYWDWEYILSNYSYQLSYSINTDIDIIIKNKDKPWNWSMVTSNLKNYEYLIKYKNLPWDWKIVSSSHKLNIHFIRNNPNLPWDWVKLTLLFDFNLSDWYLMEKILQNKLDTILEDIMIYGKMNTEFIMQNPTYNWILKREER